MKIQGFRLDDSEVFKLGEHFDDVYEKLSHLGVEIKIGEDETDGLVSFVFMDRGIELVFDKEARLAGFVNDTADGTNQISIEITLVLEDGEDLNLTVGQFAYTYTNKQICLDEIKETELEGVFSWNKVKMEDAEYLIQVTETFDTEEVVSMLRLDISEMYPVRIVKGTKELVNLTKLVA